LSPLDGLLVLGEVNPVEMRIGELIEPLHQRGDPSARVVCRDGRRRGAVVAAVTVASQNAGCRSAPRRAGRERRTAIAADVYLHARSSAASRKRARLPDRSLTGRTEGQLCARPARSLLTRCDFLAFHSGASGASDECSEPRRDGNRGHQSDAADECAHDFSRDNLAVCDRAQRLACEYEQDKERQRGACVCKCEGVHGRTDMVSPDS
jgi:hypothetical protein